MELLNTIRLAMQDAARAERLMADPRFLVGLRRYPSVALRTFSLGHTEPRRDADLRAVEQNVLLRRVA